MANSQSYRKKTYFCSRMKSLIDKLESAQFLTKEELVQLIDTHTSTDADYLFERARVVRQKHFGTSVYLRGLIEVSSYCHNDCLYCGIRHSNASAERYRLTDEQILSCCEQGYQLGFRTFVLQGGEDGKFTDDRMVQLLTAIKQRYPECAVTLSLGERKRESYQRMFDAGADRYLLRHETANAEHYGKLHPQWMSHQKRLQCLQDLKEIGYQVGTGFMVGSPFQTTENIAEDLLFIARFKPAMVGIGPYIPHHATPFANEKAGTVKQTLFLLGLLRLLKPDLLLPATTALGTLDPQGREKGLLAGANVIMPNLSPENDRSKYMIYDNKLATGAESAEGLAQLKNIIESVGYHIEQTRGDAPGLSVISDL